MNAPHQPGRRLAPRALLLALSVTAAFMVVELLTGALAGSLALVSDAGHMLTDAAGLLLAFAAASLARRGPDARRTYGYARLEVMAVPVHVTLLLGIAAYIVFEAIGRFGDAPEIRTAPVIVVGLAGLALNLFVLRLLTPYAHDNLNAKAARLEALADAAGSGVVVASATAIALGAWPWLDIAAALLIASAIVPRAWQLLRQAGDILLESVPAGLDAGAIMDAAREVEGVLDLHDVHVWSIAPSFPALSAHVEMSDVACTERILTDLAELLRDRFGIGHVTLQPETPALHEQIQCCLSADFGRLDSAAHAHAPTTR